MQLATTKQVLAINAILAKAGLMDTKAEMISNATNGRTTSSRELTIEEARDLLKSLNSGSKGANEQSHPSKKMVGKLFAMAHEIGYVKRVNVVRKGVIQEKKDYEKLYTWISKYGYLKKPLNEYTYNELPKLVSQFEKYIYYPYFSNI